MKTRTAITDLPLPMDTSMVRVAFGQGATGGPPTTDLQRGARTFLKRLANALDLKPGKYSLVNHSGTMRDAGEAVLRCGRLLVVVSQDEERQLRVSCSCITPGERTDPEAIHVYDFRTLFTPTGQHRLLDQCRSIVQPAARPTN